MVMSAPTGETFWQCPVCEHMAADLARLQEDNLRAQSDKDAELRRAYAGWSCAEASLAALRTQVEKVTGALEQKWRDTAAEGGLVVNREQATQVFNETLLSCANELAALRDALASITPPQ